VVRGGVGRCGAGLGGSSCVFVAAAAAAAAAEVVQGLMQLQVVHQP